MLAATVVVAFSAPVVSVPVSALFENLEGGATLDQFLAWFPGVTHAQAEVVLEHAAQA